jgi:hypothetical protein
VGLLWVASIQFVTYKWWPRSAACWRLRDRDWEWSLFMFGNDPREVATMVLVYGELQLSWTVAHDPRPNVTKHTVSKNGDFRRSLRSQNKNTLCGDRVLPSLTECQRLKILSGFLRFFWRQLSAKCRENRRNDVTLCLRAYISVCSHFPYFLDDVVEIWYSSESN